MNSLNLNTKLDNIRELIILKIDTIDVRNQVFKQKIDFIKSKKLITNMSIIESTELRKTTLKKYLYYNYPLLKVDTIYSCLNRLLNEVKHVIYLKEDVQFIIRLEDKLRLLEEILFLNNLKIEKNKLIKILNKIDDLKRNSKFPENYKDKDEEFNKIFLLYQRGLSSRYLLDIEDVYFILDLCLSDERREVISHFDVILSCSNKMQLRMYKRFLNFFKINSFKLIIDKFSKDFFNLTEVNLLNLWESL